MLFRSYKIVDDTLVETIVTDWHEQGDTEYQNSQEQFKYMRIIDNWMQLEGAKSYFNDLINQ